MSGYRPFRLADLSPDGATLAKVATLPVEEPRTVATVATVARPDAENSAAEGRTVATVAASQEGVAETCAPDPDTPTGWRSALLALPADRDPCPGFRADAWPRVLAHALDFIDRHGAEAHALGWTAEELFGVHPVVGVIRPDCCGALMLSVAGQVLAIKADVIRFANGLTFRRSFGTARPVPVWAFGRADASTSPAPAGTAP